MITLKSFLERTPPELAADIYRQGIYLTGGASQVSHLAELIQKGTGLKVNVSENPITSVALGLSRIIKDDNLKNRCLFNRRNEQMSPIIKKEKEKKFTLPGKYLLFILTILCIGLIVLTFNTNLLSAPVSAVGGFLITPLQNGISKAGSLISSRAEELEQIRSLLKENEELKAQIDELTMENIKLQQDRYELTNLRELYDLDAQYDDYPKIGARIIAKDSGNWYHSFVIDKGYDDGLSINMNVMAGSGLVGRITDVGPNWSKVIAIIDDNSNVSGMVLSTSDNLIVCGDLELYDDGLIRFEKLVDNADRVVEGDKIVTSHVSDKYLPGILIGYISSISMDANNLTKSGLITPAVDFEHLEEVLVITELKQVVED